ncbi:MAG TPA: hypothetical protein VG755_35235 [Nannocystaceae bacterium]|nr:hypothetical protein [Nannocystaceae bacterium]
MRESPRGYNHDVRYRGRVFHVQSEVSAGRRRQACTQLFVGGTVLATERNAIEEAMSSADIDAMLRTQHKAVLRELCRGAFDAWIDPESVIEVEPVPIVRTPAPTQSIGLRRNGVSLELVGRDDAGRGEVVVEARAGKDVLAVRRTSYELADDAHEVDALIDNELQSMLAKIRRGGLDARLPVYRFIPPPIPTR